MKNNISLLMHKCVLNGKQCVDLAIHQWKGQFLKLDEDFDQWFIVGNQFARNIKRSVIFIEY
jgi:hypothetical protein